MNSWNTSWCRNSNSGARGVMLCAAPVDHPLVRVDAQIAARPRSCLQQLPGQPAAAAAVVEHEVVGVLPEAARKCCRATGVSNVVGFGRADQVPELQRRQRQIDQRLRSHECLASRAKA